MSSAVIITTRGGEGACAGLRQHVEAAHARQPDVEQHQSTGCCRSLASASGPSPAWSVTIAAVLQQRRDGVTEGAVVVDDEHVPGGVRVRHA